MTIKVVSKERLLADRRSRPTVEEQVPYTIKGVERAVTKRIAHGEMEVLDLTRPIGELLTTPAGLENLVQKTVIDMELGRESMPLLYGSIYRRREDPAFTEHIDIGPFIMCQIVFLEHAELEEVKFGARKIGPKETVSMVTYAAGMQWTEDMVMYDKTWEISEMNRAFGEAYNALLNHLHLYPIIGYSYSAKNQTALQEGATRLEALRATLRKALIDARKDKHSETLRRRKPSIILAHPANEQDLLECMQRMQIGGTVYPPLAGLDTLILYDGHTLQVGEKVYEYPGVPEDKAYLVEPKRYFWELIKHDLRVEADNADLSRLIEKQVVGRARRTLIASPANGVQEVTIAA